jgi:transcriptional regulator with XRE-family HTH domain
MLSIGAAVKRIRERLGKTQLELSAMVGVRENSVWRWEKDASRPSGIALVQLMELAEGEEKEPLARALKLDLGTRVDLTDGWREIPGTGSWLPREILRTRSWPLSDSFAEGTYEPPTAEIISLWKQYKHNRKALKHFRDAAAFLRVQLAGLDKKKDE